MVLLLLHYNHKIFIIFFPEIQKAQIKQISNTLSRNKRRSANKKSEYPSDYEHLFKASNITNNLILGNFSWHSL